METIPTPQLVAAAVDGDRAAWDELVNRFDRLVWAVARSFRLPPADAADVSQATWLRLVESLATIQDPDHLPAWLATTARREALRTLKQSGRETPTEVDDVEERKDVSPSPETLALLSDEYRRLWRAYAELPEPCQMLLWLIVASPEGTYAEVAESLGMRIGSIGPTRARCLDRLRRRMEAD